MLLAHFHMLEEVSHLTIDIVDRTDSDRHNTWQLEFFHAWWLFCRGFNDLQRENLCVLPAKLTISSPMTRGWK